MRPHFSISESKAVPRVGGESTNVECNYKVYFLQRRRQCISTFTMTIPKNQTQNLCNFQQFQTGNDIYQSFGQYHMLFHPSCFWDLALDSDSWARVQGFPYSPGSLLQGAEVSASHWSGHWYPRRVEARMKLSLCCSTCMRCVVVSNCPLSVHEHLHHGKLTCAQRPNVHYRQHGGEGCIDLHHGHWREQDFLTEVSVLCKAVGGKNRTCIYNEP